MMSNSAKLQEEQHLVFDLFLFNEIVWALILLTIFVVLLVVFIHDIRQKDRSLLRNYPVVGHLRDIFERLGVLFRQYFFAMDREEMPFNRTERAWVYQAAKDTENVVGFGSTRNLQPVGTVFFVNAPFAVLGRDSAPAHPVTVGPQCQHPYTTASLFNVSAMSFGAISKPAILALTQGAKKAGCWVNTGEGGLSPAHLEAGCDLIAQIGTAKFGFRDAEGNLSEKKLKAAAAHKQVRMFEVKLSQGAKPGKGGILPGVKINEEIASIRGVKMGEDAISPNRFFEISNANELLDFIAHVREVTGKPVGCKFVLGDKAWIEELCTTIKQRGLDHAPDFITLDSADGGTGAAPLSLVDYVGLPLKESLPIVVDTLHRFGLRERIKIIASGKLINPAEVAWALCVGADFINSARGFMFALGCIQAMTCHNNRCPTGVATQNARLNRAIVPECKAIRVAHYAKNMAFEVGVIAHSCGVKEARELQRKHARVMTENGTSVLLAELHPDVKEES